ncbi:MAG: hemin-degrading factor [Bacteroidia bacterium]|nr:hemin-degrading factor [Bacteroidia bacterium]
MSQTPLKAAYERLKAEKPHLYLRDAASILEVSEMALLPVAYGEDAVPLRPAFVELLRSLVEMGPLMALSRNEWVVIETTGTYPEPTFEGPIGVLHSPIIDLRLYLMHWAHAYAVRSFGKDGKPLYSLQFFTHAGEAIHKVYLRDPSHLDRWGKMVDRFRVSEHPEPVSSEVVPSSGAVPVPSAFVEEWAALQDTHDFHQLLRRHRLSRIQAVRLAEGHFSWKLASTSVEDLLKWAKDSQTPIMFFVGNPGIHHIFTGTVKELSPARGWVNILDEVFTLHLNPAGIAEVYLVEKPTREGSIYSVEVFGPRGEEVLWIFGARKPGLPVPEGWVRYIESLRAAV